MASARARPCIHAVAPSTAMAIMPLVSLVSSSSPVADPRSADTTSAMRGVRHGCWMNMSATTNANSPPISDGKVKSRAAAMYAMGTATSTLPNARRAATTNATMSSARTRNVVAKASAYVGPVTSNGNMRNPRGP